MTTRLAILLVTLSVIAGACSSAGPAPQPAPDASVIPTLPPTPTPFSPVADPTATPTPTPEPTATAPVAVSYGPDDFPSDVDPLSGLKVSDPSLLERRPLAVKVANFPRYSRPQWGLSLADIVYEIYQNGGISRFHAIFYGNDSERVGPIRSARNPDAELIRMYESVFAFGSADFRVLNLLNNSEYAARVVNEYPAGCGPMCRVDPSTTNHLVTNTQDLSQYISSRGVSNTRQNLPGMYFNTLPPQGGQSVESVFVRYGSAFASQVYARWDHDPATNRLLRFTDTQDDFGGGEVYEQLTDRLTEDPIRADNMVVLLAQHVYLSRNPEIVDIEWRASGPAYVFRDGRAYMDVRWVYSGPGRLLTLVASDGTPFPFKPGNTWFEVIGQSSQVTQPENGIWRFQFSIP